MINELKRIIKEELPSMILDRSRWHGVFTKIRKPTFARLYTILPNKYRLSLHSFTDPDLSGGDSAFHIHAWPMAATIISGKYFMEVGRTKNSDDTKPTKVFSIELGAGSFYEMMDTLTWHKVIPITTTAYSIMLNGLHWNPMPEFLSKGKEYLSIMTDNEKNKYFEYFQGVL